jgi:hypothetical protein
LVGPSSWRVMTAILEAVTAILEAVTAIFSFYSRQ